MSLLGVFLGIAREAVIQAKHSLVPTRRRDHEHLELAAQLFNRLSQNHCFQESFRCLLYHLGALNRFDRLPLSPGGLQCYGLHSCWMSMFGWASRGEAFAGRATKYAREQDDVFGTGVANTFAGIGLYAAARYDQSLTALRTAAEAFEKVGDRWTANLARFHEACCHYGRGELPEAIALARTNIDSSLRVGDSRLMCSTYLLARVTEGDLPFEQLKANFPCRPDDVMSTVHGMMAEGLWHRRHDRTEQELATLEAAARLVRTTRCVNSHTILVMPHLAAALRRRAECIADQDPRRSRDMRRRGIRIARWSARLTPLFRAAYPPALRELSLSLAANDQLKKALRVAERSCVAASRQGARYEHALSLQIRGQLASQLQRPDADQWKAQAESELRELGVGA